MYEDFTILQFEKAWFKNDFTEMTEEQFGIVLSEYIDAAELYETEEFEKVLYIVFMSNRINTVRLYLKMQADFLKEFDVPYIRGFEFFKKFGYYLKWKDDAAEFLQTLETILFKEGKYEDELADCEKELKEFREKKKKGEPLKGLDPKKARKNFVNTIISLGKEGYSIIKNVTTVEELALIIKKQKEEIKNLEQQR